MLGPQELVQVALNARGLRGGALHQRPAHVRVKRLGQFSGGRLDAAAVTGGAEQLPEEGKHLLLHQLRFARVQLRHQL